MANVYDVAKYILGLKSPLTTWKLQKLVYYSQAWSLVWDETPLFDEKIEAWANGPVVRELFDVYRGRFRISNIEFGAIENLTKDEKDTIEIVVNYYGEHSSQYLSDLTHMEAPWLTARSGIPDNVRSDREITLESMAEYYGGLNPEED